MIDVNNINVDDFNIESPAIAGCCPLEFNCFKKTGNKLNYYPGDCPNFEECNDIAKELYPENYDYSEDFI